MAIALKHLDHESEKFLKKLSKAWDDIRPVFFGILNSITTLFSEENQKNI